MKKYVRRILERTPVLSSIQPDIGLLPRSRGSAPDSVARGALELEKFDFGAPAELFPRKHATKSKQIGYLRFASAAEAIRYAIESVPPALLIGTSMLTDDERYLGKAIRKLYDDPAYPLYRKT